MFLDIIIVIVCSVSLEIVIFFDIFVKNKIIKFEDKNEFFEFDFLNFDLNF